MSSTASVSCQVALKEWASVIEAMGRGEQLVLIRKGGLVEAARGFEIRSMKFVLYPTFEHQTITYLRDPYRQYLEEALTAKPPEGQVRLELVGRVVLSRESHDPTLVRRLESFHIYNDVFLEQRLKWRPEQPLVVAVVRALRLPAPQIVPVSDHYAGCKSWVDLDHPVSVHGAAPVLDDRTFDERLRRIRGLLEA